MIIFPFYIPPSLRYSRAPKPDTYKRKRPKIGRNELCPCGGGKKYKKCCIEKGGDMNERGDS